jgi:abortive infection bacteriophage resistance protein
VRYTKPPLTFEKQADLLLSRGLIADRGMLIERLTSVNYYRLTGYLFPFRRQDDTFQPNTTLDLVWHRYVFDRQLRLLVLDAIERVEVSVRTIIVYEHCHECGPFGYIDPANLPKLSQNDFGEFLRRARDDTRKSKEAFALHFKSKYGDVHTDLPLWMAVELMSMGSLLTLFRGMTSKSKKTCASQYHITWWMLENWLLCLNTIRNMCAHHARLWNRTLGIKPVIPPKNPEWHTPVEVYNDRMFAILTLLKYVLSIVAPQSKWQDRLESLMGKYPQVPSRDMGFPQNWKDCPIWGH